MSNVAPVNTATEPSTWANLPPVVVGALIALLGSLVVQGWLVPRIEARKRREQRWETDLRDLGDLLASREVRRKAAAAQHTQWFYRWLTEQSDADVNSRQERLRETSEELRRTRNEHEDVMRGPVEWLLSRVVAHAPKSDELRALELAGLSLRVAIITVSVDLTHAPDTWDQEHIFQEWNNEKEKREAVLTRVTELLDAKRPPRNTVRQRARRWWVSAKVDRRKRRGAVKE